MFEKVKQKISRVTIKDAFDNLPTGLCFSDDNGFPILINRVMYELCHQITGTSLQNAIEFWQTINEGELIHGVERISVGAQIIINLHGEFRTFTRKYIQLEGRNIMQLTAADTTELCGLVKQLKEDNEVLQQLNKRLRQYNKDLQDLTRKQEYLEIKMRLHNEFGKVLLQTRKLLHHPVKEEDEQERLAAWRETLNMIYYVSEPQSPRLAIDQLLEAAKAIGVSVVVLGKLPSSIKMMETLTVAASEALTNAVRHAEATQLTLRLFPTPNTLTVQFTNNGAPPSVPITEGGGLGNLRQRLERAGGAMDISCDPEYCLTISILQEE